RQQGAPRPCRWRKVRADAGHDRRAELHSCVAAVSGGVAGGGRAGLRVASDAERNGDVVLIARRRRDVKGHRALEGLPVVVDGKLPLFRVEAPHEGSLLALDRMTVAEEIA